MGTTPPNRRNYVPNSPNHGVSNKNKSSIRHIVDQTDTKKVEFLNQVTKEILSRGKFTEKAIKRALESQLNNSHLIQNVTMTEKTALINKLKMDLGLEQRPSSSHSKTILRQRSSNSESSTSSPKELKRLRDSFSNVSKKQPYEIRDNQYDDELSSLLRDESDADLVDIIKCSVRNNCNAISKPSQEYRSVDQEYRSVDDEQDEMPRREIPKATTGPGKVLDSLNLSNLNVSFNSSSVAEAKRRLEESKKQALLVKSFAYQEDEKKREGSFSNVPKEATKEEFEPDQDEDSRRSSELYQSDSDHFEEEEEEENEDDENVNTAKDSNSSTTSTSDAASAIDDEDIPYESELD